MSKKEVASVVSELKKRKSFNSISSDSDILQEFYAQDLKRISMSFWISMIFFGLGVIVITVCILFGVLGNVTSSVIMGVIVGLFVNSIGGIYYTISKRKQRSKINDFNRMQKRNNIEKAVELCVKIRDEERRNEKYEQIYKAATEIN